jgi:hypothetical protein
MHKAKRMRLINEARGKGIELENEEIDIENILARNESYLVDYEYVSFCSELAKQIDETDLIGFKLLDEFKERLNEEVALIQNHDEFQKFSRVYMYINEKNKLLNS